MTMHSPDPKRKFAVEVVQRLKEEGFQALWAGGCVRDFLLGREPKDYDVATDARPEKVRELFGHRVDCIDAVWVMIADRFPWVQTLVINQDNGPECHSRRTQFMSRITKLADEFQLNIQLAYYPPYHSKYNPIERAWGVLENYWNGSLLDSLETVFHFAQNMTYNGVHPVVKIVKKTYSTGVKLTKKAMDELEKRFERLPGLEKWFVLIRPLPT